MKPHGELSRLRDAAGAPGSLEAEAADLLSAAGPFAPPAGSKAHVRAALLQRRHPAGGPWRLPAVVLALVLASAGGTVASAALGRPWVAGLLTWVAPRAKAPAPRQAARREAASNPTVVTPLAPLPAVAPIESGAERAEAGAPRAGPRAPHRAALVDRAPRPPLPVIDDDPTLVASAVRALRRDQDAARAAQLLDEYLRRWPAGALVEEALALSIEAAQLSDRQHGLAGTRARELAVRYLQGFPRGRFTETAHRALAQP